MAKGGRPLRVVADTGGAVGYPRVGVVLVAVVILVDHASTSP